MAEMARKACINSIGLEWVFQKDMIYCFCNVHLEKNLVDLVLVALDRQSVFCDWCWIILC